jgi:hypothetical protein
MPARWSVERDGLAAPPLKTWRTLASIARDSKSYAAAFVREVVDA